MIAKSTQQIAKSTQQIKDEQINFLLEDVEKKIRRRQKSNWIKR